MKHVGRIYHYQKNKLHNSFIKLICSLYTKLSFSLSKSRIIFDLSLSLSSSPPSLFPSPCLFIPQSLFVSFSFCLSFSFCPNTIFVVTRLTYLVTADHFPIICLSSSFSLHVYLAESFKLVLSARLFGSAGSIRVSVLNKIHLFLCLSLSVTLFLCLSLFSCRIYVQAGRAGEEPQAADHH